MPTLDDIKGTMQITGAFAESQEADRAQARQGQIMTEIQTALSDTTVPMQQRLQTALPLLTGLGPKGAETVQKIIGKLGEIDPSLTKDLSFAKSEGISEGSLESDKSLVVAKGEQARETQQQKLDAERRGRAGATVFESLSPVAQKQFGAVEKQFISFSEEAQKQGSKIAGLFVLADTAQDSEQAASQLGAQVASMFESGRLTDEDVKRYTRRNSIPSSVADLMLNWTKGTISEAKTEDLKVALKAFQGVLTQQVNIQALDAAKKLNSRVNTGLPDDQIAAMLYPSFDPSPTADPESSRVTPKQYLKLSQEEQGAVLNNMSDEELERFVQQLEGVQ